VAAVAVLFVLNRRFLEAVAVSISGSLPIVLFGFFSVSRGGYFLPNSLLLKHAPFGIHTVYRLMMLHKESPVIFVLVFSALLLLAFNAPSPFSRDLLKIFLFTAILHQLLAAYGWFYRYEAYLVVLGLIAVACAASSLHTAARQPLWVAAALLICTMPLTLRAWGSAYQTQMAGFFRTYYPDARIAVNDIGAICFFGDPHLLVYGLGSTEVTRAHVEHVDPLLAVRIEQNGVQVSAIYDTWFHFDGRALPEGWHKVGTWTIPEKTVVGSATVSFYAVGDQNAVQLATNLAAYRSSLPPEVTVQLQ
jgi:hypothetical protein